MGATTSSTCRASPATTGSCSWACTRPRSRCRPTVVCSPTPGPPSGRTPPRSPSPAACASLDLESGAIRDDPPPGRGGHRGRGAGLVGRQPMARLGRGTDGVVDDGRAWARAQPIAGRIAPAATTGEEYVPRRVHPLRRGGGHRRPRQRLAVRQWGREHLGRQEPTGRAPSTTSTSRPGRHQWMPGVAWRLPVPGRPHPVRPRDRRGDRPTGRHREARRRCVGSPRAGLGRRRPAGDDRATTAGRAPSCGCSPSTTSGRVWWARWTAAWPRP